MKAKPHFYTIALLTMILAGCAAPQPTPTVTVIPIPSLTATTISATPVETPIPEADDVSTVEAVWSGEQDPDEVAKFVNDFALHRVASYDDEGKLGIVDGADYGPLVGVAKLQVGEKTALLGKVTLEGGEDHLAYRTDVMVDGKKASWVILKDFLSADGEQSGLAMPVEGEMLPVFTVDKETGEVLFCEGEELHRVMGEPDGLGEIGLMAMVETLGGVDLEAGRAVMAEKGDEVRWNFAWNKGGLMIKDLESGNYLHRWESESESWVEAMSPAEMMVDWGMAPLLTKSDEEIAKMLENSEFELDETPLFPTLTKEQDEIFRNGLMMSANDLPLAVSYGRKEGVRYVLRAVGEFKGWLDEPMVVVEGPGYINYYLGAVFEIGGGKEMVFGVVYSDGGLNMGTTAFGVYGEEDKKAWTMGGFGDDGGRTDKLVVGKEMARMFVEGNKYFISNRPSESGQGVQGVMIGEDKLIGVVSVALLGYPSAEWVEREVIGRPTNWRR